MRILPNRTAAAPTNLRAARPRPRPHAEAERLGGRHQRGERRLARRAAQTGGLWALAFVASGCSLTFDPDAYGGRATGVQRATDDDAPCDAGDCGWVDVARGCLGRVRTKDEAEGAIDQTIELESISMLMPVGGVDVRACRAFDLFCTAPADAATTDDAGEARLTVPAAAWGGYFEYAAPGGMATLVHYVPAYRGGEGGALVRGGLEERTYAGPVTTFEMLSGANAASGARFALDPALGHIFGTAVGCDGRALAGAEVTIDAPGETTAVLYAADGLPSASQTVTGPAGAFYVSNVPANRFITLRARLADGRGDVGSRRAVVRAGALTVVVVGPSD
jgi:hypothetical protein